VVIVSTDEFATQKKNAVAPQIFGWKLFEVLQIPSEMFGHKSTPHIVSEGVWKKHMLQRSAGGEETGPL